KPVSVPKHHGCCEAFGPDRDPDGRPDEMHWNRHLLKRSAECRKSLCRRLHALVDGSLGGRLQETFLDDADPHTLYALAERFCVFLHFWGLDARIVTVVSGKHLEQQSVVGDIRGHWTGVVDEDLDRHDAGVRHEAP